MLWLATGGRQVMINRQKAREHLAAMILTYMVVRAELPSLANVFRREGMLVGIHQNGPGYHGDAYGDYTLRRSPSIYAFARTKITEGVEVLKAYTMYDGVNDWARELAFIIPAALVIARNAIP